MGRFMSPDPLGGDLTNPQSLNRYAYVLNNPNHVHLIVVPGDVEGLAVSMKHTHGRYASYWNVVHNSTGHAWQGRYYSCPLDRPHLWEALRYTELNPTRANLVGEATSWAWSSAAA